MILALIHVFEIRVKSTNARRATTGSTVISYGKADEYTLSQQQAQ